MNMLVKKLEEGLHPVVFDCGSTNPSDLKKRLEEQKYVFITFTDTRGRTKLGVTIDQQATDISQVDFQKGVGSVHIEGTLVLDYTRVRCIADIDLTTFSGSGHLLSQEEV